MTFRMVMTLGVWAVLVLPWTMQTADACDCMTPHRVVAGFPVHSGISGSVGFVSGPPAFVNNVDAHASYRPPGTVGETYFRTSHRIPEDKHPRIGMLAVRDKGAAKLMTVERMGGFRMKNGIWLFESSRPLDPGVSQIVRVEARNTAKDVEPYETRWVRLIPGRIVYLDF